MAIVGIAFWPLRTLSELSINFLQSVGFLSCRNRRDVSVLKKKGVEKVQFAYDSAFALPTEEYVKNKKRLGINAISRHMTWNKGEYVSNGRKEVELLFGPAYVRTLQLIAQQHISQGWDVFHIPFTKRDERFASWVFEDIPVELCTYNYRVEPTYRAVAQCSRFIGTRYHSHIFALKARVPLLSFSYSSKNRLLKEDLSIPDVLQATRQEVAQNENDVVKRFVDKGGFLLSEDKLAHIEKSVQNNIESALHTIY